MQPFLDQPASFVIAVLLPARSRSLNFWILPVACWCRHRTRPRAQRQRQRVIVVASILEPEAVERRRLVFSASHGCSFRCSWMQRRVPDHPTGPAARAPRRCWDVLGGSHGPRPSVEVSAGSAQPAKQVRQVDQALGDDVAHQATVAGALATRSDAQCWNCSPFGTWLVTLKPPHGAEQAGAIDINIVFRILHPKS